MITIEEIIKTKYNCNSCKAELIYNKYFDNFSFQCPRLKCNYKTTIDGIFSNKQDSWFEYEGLILKRRIRYFGKSKFLEIYKKGTKIRSPNAIDKEIKNIELDNLNINYLEKIVINVLQNIIFQ